MAWNNKTLLSLQSWNSEVWNHFHWAKVKDISKACFFQRLRREHFIWTETWPQPRHIPRPSPVSQLLAGWQRGDSHAELYSRRVSIHHQGASAWSGYSVSSFPDSFAHNACMPFFLHLCVLDLPSPLSVSFRQMKKLRLREGKQLSWLQSYILELYVSGSPVSWWVPSCTPFFSS